MIGARGWRVAAGTLTAAAAVAALASFATAEDPLTPAARAGGGECAKAGEPVRTLSTGAVRKAVVCLLNEERRRHARKPLDRSKALQKAGQQHAKKMAATDCLSHQCDGEPSLDARIRQSGYTNGAKKWKYAENTGCGLSAEAMVRNWMASLYHRINILDRAFEDVGIGFTNAHAGKRCKDAFGTFAAVFGMRDPG